MRKKSLFIAGVIFLTALIFFFFIAFEKFQKEEVFARLKEAIAQEAAGKNFRYYLLIKDLTFPRVELSYNPDQTVRGASLLKLPILAVVFEAVREGKLSLADNIVIKKEDITGGSGKLKTFKLPYQLKILELLELMISTSDNTATNKVIDLLGYDYLNETFKKIGLEGTSLKRKMMDFSQRKQGVENYTNARDITLILEKIYDRKLIGEDFSDLALFFLKNQKVNDRLPRYLPQEAVVAHKTGLERGAVHDAGIVFTPAGDYIICVLVDGLKRYTEAKKFIAQISLLTYNLYTGRGKSTLRLPRP